MSLLNRARQYNAMPFVFFSIIMALKIYIAWFAIFDGTAPWRPLLKEIPFIWVTFCLIEWFSSKRKMTIYLIVNLIITAVLFAAIMYYKYYGVIVTYRALQQVNQVTAVKNSVFSLLDPYYLFIFLDIIVLGFWLIRKKRASKLLQFFNLRRMRGGVAITIFTLSFALCIFNVWPNRASMNEIKQAEQMGILNYETYAIFKKESELTDKRNITQAKVNQIKGITPVMDPAYFGAAKGKNLIMIQMESFQNFLIDFKLNGIEVTPTMNKLVKENLYFNHFYQMVGQGNTSDAEFVVNTSFYIPYNEAATQNYASKQLPSLPKLLKSEGYQTATFHTNVVSFWNRGELYEALGFDKYYDKEFFGTEDTVFFGASDEVLYKKTNEEIQRMYEAEKPFYAHVLSMTAHHPFTLPEEKQLFPLPESYQGNMVGDYIQAQHYADKALGEFIDDLKAKGIWEDSLVVIYGDHLGLPMYSLDKHGLELMQEIHGDEYSYKDMINIPLIISLPGVFESEVYNNLGGQVDILPTLANLFGISLEHQLHFGQDLLNQSYNLLPQRYYLPSGSFLNNKALFLPGVEYSDGTHYPLDESSSSVANLTTEDEYNRALELLHLSDSYVRQLPDLPKKDD